MSVKMMDRDEEGEREGGYMAVAGCILQPATSRHAQNPEALIPSGGKGEISMGRWDNGVIRWVRNDGWKQVGMCGVYSGELYNGYVARSERSAANCVEMCKMAKIVMISVFVGSKWDWRRLAVWYLSFFLLSAS